jgi:hypothetical protein
MASLSLSWCHSHCHDVTVMTWCHCHCHGVTVTVMASLSLSWRHCHCHGVTVMKWRHCHCHDMASLSWHGVTVMTSLSWRHCHDMGSTWGHCHGVTAMASLSLSLRHCHCHDVTVTTWRHCHDMVSLSLSWRHCHCHDMASLSLCHAMVSLSWHDVTVPHFGAFHMNKSSGLLAYFVDVFVVPRGTDITFSINCIVLEICLISKSVLSLMATTVKHGQNNTIAASGTNINV